ncbi:MAG: hypothetical protein LBU88_04185 [Treponema sp.]|nr:hypothetical protein [Treponema sp.]
MYSENEKSQKKFLGGYLNFVDSTKFFTTPFSWLYVIVALAFLALPVIVLAQGIDVKIFEGDGKIVFGFILLLIASIFGAIIGFVIAWNGRKNENVGKITIDLIIDSVADLLGLIIKSLAHFLGVFGFFAGLFALLFGDRLLGSLGIGLDAIHIMIGVPLFGYGLVWFSRLFKFLFAKISRIIVMVIVQVFKFVIYAIATIYNFIAHIVKQLFSYFFILIQAQVDLLVNGLKVVIALVARLGRFLLAYAASPFKNKDYNDAKVTYNE